jgi:hypothetical protein
MLESVNVPITFDGGLDTKTDEKLVLPGRLLTLENGTRVTGKKIRKRNGYQPLNTAILGGSTSITSAIGAAIARTELMLFTAGHLYSYSPGAAGWLDKGAIYSVRVGSTQIARNAYQQTTPDMAVNGSISVFAWSDSRGGVRATVVDQASGSPILSDSQIGATGKNPRCLAVGNYIFVIWADTGTLKFRRLNILAPTSFEASANIGTDLNANAYHDAAVSGTNLVVAYHTASSTIKITYLTQDGVVGSTTIGLPNAVTFAEAASNLVAMAVEPTTQDICVCWHNATNGLRSVIVARDFTTKVGITTIDASIAPAALRATPVFSTTTQVTFFYEMNATNAYDHFLKTNTLTTAAAVGTASVIKRSVGLASKVFKIGAEYFLNVVHDSPLQATYFSMRSDGTLMGKLQPTTAGGLPADRIVPQVCVDSSLKARFPATVKTKIETGANTTFTLTGISQETLDFGPQSIFQASYIGNSLHISGGIVSIYDGVSPVELGFHLFPEFVTLAGSTTGGSMLAGTYQYYAVYEWIDNQGKMHRSAPSIGKAVTTTGTTSSVVVTVGTLRLTEKRGTRSPVVISIYRTEANGSTPYKVTSIASPTLNDVTVDTVTFTDTFVDTAITAAEILYTTGGVIENIGPPAAGCIATSKNRAVLTDLEDELAFWYSKKILPNDSDAVSFTDAFTGKVDPVGGKLYCGALMDDKIILFKESRLFFVSGDGPDDLGNGIFTDPQEIPSDVGCKFPNSIVLTPKGLMFKSNKGIYLLDRSLQVSYVGADVDAFNSQNITSAVLVDNKNQVRFTTDTSGGSTLVYDYYFDQWSTFTNHTGVAAGIWNNVYVYVRTNGQVYQETENYFLDNNVGYKLRVGTAWIKPGGVQGFVRVWRAAILGTFKSDHVLRIAVGYNYESTYPDSYYFSAGDVIDTNYYGQGAYFGAEPVYGGVEDAVYQCTVHLKRQKCEAIRFLFEDVTSGTAGESYDLSDLTLKVGVKKGLFKMKPSKKVG